uniref:Uncharacterized protein n=1 Tax=Rhizophora mucronata TaxID=61149 RepID=A0A2P2P0A7_RHIMU
MQPVPSSTANFRNLLGLSSREVTTPRISARERDVPLREKETGPEGAEEEGFCVREWRSTASSFTCVFFSL